ncbi:MAG: S24 family peptidase [Verrucomicrobiaceae bacterium]|nr:MAG: S24 family peptidase [Verrucomicrobiaceae bacterium]
MDQNRLRAEDVAAPLQVSEQTIHNWRSSGVPARRLPHVQSFMESWVDPRGLERERDRDATTGQIHTPTQVPAELRLDAFVMRPGLDEFDDWNRAANASGLTVREWITDTLERAAREFKRTGRLPGEKVTHLHHPDLDTSEDVVAFPRTHTHPRSNKRLASTLAEEEPSLPRKSKSTKSTKFTHAAGTSTGTWIDLRGGVAAGAPISSHIVEEPVRVKRTFPDDHYALRVFGQSMEPKIPDGALIIVKHWPREKGTPRKGTIVVYSDGTGSTLKEFGYRKAKPSELTEADAMGNIPVLRSLNKAYPEVQTLEDGKIDAILVEVG